MDDVQSERGSGSEAGPLVVYHFDKVVTLEELQKLHIKTALEHSGGNKKIASEMLGVTLKTLYNKLAEYPELKPLAK